VPVIAQPPVVDFLSSRVRILALIGRAGKHAIVIHAWTIPDSWDDLHHLEIAVAIIDTEGNVSTRAERLRFWPFLPQTLEEDLRAVGMAPTSTSYSPAAERYVITAKRRQ
jgi:hypothetical protein